MRFFCPPQLCGASRIMLQVWDTTNLVPLYVLDPYLQTDAGDIYSLAWSQSRETVYFGCQNTAIQWYQFGKDSVMAPLNSQPRPVHKFFAGSHPQYQHLTPTDPTSDLTPAQSSNATSSQPQCTVLSIPATNIVSSAHHGYVYCMAVSPSPHQGSDDILYTDTHSPVYLVTGSGDESVKVSCRSFVPHEFNERNSCGIALPPHRSCNTHSSVIKAQSCPS